MDSVFDGDAAFLEHVCKLAYYVLRLRRRESIAGHEHDFVRVSELRGDAVETDFTHRSLMVSAGDGCRCASERTEQNIRHRAIHRATHQDRQDESGKTVERAGNDEHFV